jgi:hypothetical protein
MKPLFQSNAVSVLNDVRETFESRGVEYGDTWRNCRWLALLVALREVFGFCLPNDESLRTIAAAVFLDVKYSRLEGEAYKEDTLIDLIAYAPNFVAQMRKLRSLKDV